MLSALVGPALALAIASTGAALPSPERISQRKGDYSLGPGSISANERYILFESSAKRLVPQRSRPNVGWARDVYVYDRVRERAELINVRPDGQRSRDVINGYDWTQYPQSF